MSKEICGYAIIFNNWYKTFDRETKEIYYERILPTALTQEFVNTQKVHCRLQHNDDYILASNYIGREVLTRKDSNGNERIMLTANYIGDGKLKLTVDEKGLWYSFEVNESPEHRAVTRMINNKILNGSSHTRGSWKKEEDDEIREGIKYRTIRKIEKLTDVSPCAKGANSLCTVEIKYDDNENLELQKYLKEYAFNKHIKQLQKEYLPTIYN